MTSGSGSCDWPGPVIPLLAELPVLPPDVRATSPALLHKRAHALSMDSIVAQQRFPPSGSPLTEHWKNVSFYHSSLSLLKFLHLSLEKPSLPCRPHTRLWESRREIGGVSRCPPAWPSLVSSYEGWGELWV